MMITEREKHLIYGQAQKHIVDFLFQCNNENVYEKQVDFTPTEIKLINYIKDELNIKIEELSAKMRIKKASLHRYLHDLIRKMSGNCKPFDLKGMTQLDKVKYLIKRLC